MATNLMISSESNDQIGPIMQNFEMSSKVVVSGGFFLPWIIYEVVCLIPP